MSEEWGAFAASQITLLHIKRFNKTESPIFLCVLCFKKQTFTFLFLFLLIRIYRVMDD